MRLTNERKRELIPQVRRCIRVSTRKPSYRWQTSATRKHAKNCSNSTCLQRCRWQYWSNLHSFSCCCVQNLRNSAKFSENSNS